MTGDNFDPNTELPDTTQLEERVNQLTAELDEARGRALRALADFQNFQRRASQNEQVARQQGMAGVIMSVVPVLDNFDHALGHDATKGSVEQIMAGVRVIREELMRALGKHGVTLIAPAANDEFVPGRHEAIMQQPADGVDSGRIVATFQPGYVLNDFGTERVLRAAKVSVAP